MKICLIDAAAINTRRFLPHWTPLGLAYIAAMLEQDGHEVLIIERDVLFRKNRLNIKKVDFLMGKMVQKFNPNLIGMSSSTELFPDIINAARILKTILPDVPIVYGGHHASALPIDILKICNDIDVVAIGEGESIMRELAANIPKKDIKGICFRKGDTFITTPPRPPIEPLDSLPLPARHLLDMEFYTKPSPNTIRNLTLKTTTMLTSRGCPFSCKFCVESLPMGKKHRIHSTHRVIEELEGILSNYEVEAIYFLDEGFLTNEARVRELCEIMIKDGYNKRVKWSAQVRVDALDQDLLKLMKEAGCIQLECGFETASDRLLKTVDKKTSQQKNREIVRLIKSAGIRCFAYIIAGLPGETEEEFQASIDFIKTSGIDAVAFARFVPHPGSIFYNELTQKGMLPERFWQAGGKYYNQLNFSAIPDERAKALYEQAWDKIVYPLNQKDRMKHTSFPQLMKRICSPELVYRVLNEPSSLLRSLRNWIQLKLTKVFCPN